MEEFQNLVSVEHREKLVLTTAQLAEFYGCSVRNISDNFKRNENRFVVGKHFFCLEGDNLRKFREYSAKSGLVLSSNTPRLYLWTERGAARHAKMLSTDEAWEVFEELEDCYFNRQPVNSLPAKNTKSARCDVQLKPACVYVLLMSNDIVKIGYTGNLRRRVTKLENQSGLTVNKMHFTPFTNREVARLVEWVCQKNFSSRKVKGEFFSVDFNKVCAAVDDFFAKVVHACSYIMKIESPAAIDF